MSSDNQQEVSSENKVQTRYDRKIEERKKKAAKDAREAKLLKIGSIVIIAAIAIAIVASVVLSIIDKKVATKDTYVKIGEHEITKLEYDYFFKSTVNNYIATYGSFLSYMGLDTTVSYEKQQYSDTMTWQDLFDQMTVDQIKQIKVLADDAAKNGFTHDSTEEYNNIIDTVETSAKDAKVSLDRYCKATYGSYATMKNVEPFMKENLFASAYYQDLITKNAPAETEIKDYYTENKDTLDRFDYRSFVFTSTLAAEATQEEIDSVMAELNEKANAMMEERKAGKDFEELSLANASEEQKANYEDTATEYSLTEGMQSAGISQVISSWLMEAGRAEGDITVIADDVSHQVYVVEYVNRYFDEADNETISNTISTERVSEYLATLNEAYTVTDVAGKLKYLTIPVTPEAVPEETEAAPADTTAADAEAAPADTTAAEADATPADAEAAPADTTAAETEAAPADTTAADAAPADEAAAE